MNRLKIYALTTESHDILLKDWFLKTMPADCEPVIKFMDSGPVAFREGHWHKIFAKKVEMVLAAIAHNAGKMIVVSDVDIQFFKPLASDLSEKMRDYDILFQNNACGWSTDVVNLCAGFMVVNCSERVRPFFEKALSYITDKDDPTVDDQVAYADILHLFPDLRIGLLPNSYWTNAVIWRPGGSMNPPADIMMHHANWVLGVVHKLAQLKLVREWYSLSNI